MNAPTPQHALAAAVASCAPHGMHWLVDCHGVDATLLGDVDTLRALLREAADAAGAHVLFDHFHAFGVGTDDAPAGVTGVVLLAESHATIHTWPEAGFAAIDFFLCGETRPEDALARIERRLCPGRIALTKATRGA